MKIQCSLLFTSFQYLYDYFFQHNLYVNFTALPESYITFGTYEQDNRKKNGQEPIQWLVLENNVERLFVLIKYVLDGLPYNTAYGF